MARGGGQLDRDHRGGLPGGEQGVRDDFHRHRRGPLTHPDHHHPVPKHVHITAFHGGQHVSYVVVAVVR